MIAVHLAAALGLVNPTAVPPRPPPRLAVVLVVDQMRADYLDRFRPILSHGLLRLRNSGQRFTNARHMHAVTNTGPGHATLSTGTHPARHGIVSNTLPGEEPGTFHTAALDRKERNLNRNAPGASPRDLLTSAIGDWLKAEQPEARVVALGYKARSAVLLGGQRPDVAVYADSQTGEFTSSSYYAREQPTWITDFNRDHPASALVGRRWEPRLSEAQFRAAGTTPDAMPYEGRLGLGNPDDSSFPKLIQRVADLIFSPYGDQRTLALAQAAVSAYSLGADATTDLLLISLSAADYIGHTYGPDSREVCDYYAWLDQALTGFFATLDQAAGTEGWGLVLCADHGINPTVEQLLAQGLDAGRVRQRNLLAEVDLQLDQRFGEEDWVLAALPDLYLNPTAVRNCGVDLERVRDEAIRAARSVRGIRAAYSHRNLARGEKAIPESFRFSFHPQRSGDVLLQFERHYHFDYLDSSPYVKASHGSQHDYDQRVPMIFIGPGIPAGIRPEPFPTIDLAPTLSGWIGVTPPEGLDGRAHELFGPARNPR